MWRRLTGFFFVFLASVTLFSEEKTYDPFFLKPSCPPARYCNLSFKGETLFYYYMDNHEDLYDIVLSARKNKKKVLIDGSKFVKCCNKGFNLMRKNLLNNTVKLYDKNIEFNFIKIDKKSVEIRLSFLASLMGKIAYYIDHYGMLEKYGWIKRKKIKYLETLKSEKIWINKTAFDDPERYLDYLKPWDLFRPSDSL